jgi:hypothetical protein
VLRSNSDEYWRAQRLPSGASSLNEEPNRRRGETPTGVAAMTTHKDAVTFDDVLASRLAVTLLDLVIVATVYHA